MHRSLGGYIKNTKVDLLIAIGELAAYIYEGFDDPEKSRFFSSKQEFILDIGEFLRAGDAVLIKASRKMAFEDIITALAGGRCDFAE
jgi:UDP-N-acetylmuramoyl-tripeptide--D-alanyl-D-alanine ligase